MFYRFKKIYVNLIVLIVGVGFPTHDMKLIKKIYQEIGAYLY